jgi:hypothetical protein
MKLSQPRYIKCLHRKLKLLNFRFDFFFKSKEQIQISGSTMDAWDYEENLDLIDYMPQRNNFFDIWQYEVGTI